MTFLGGLLRLHSSPVPAEDFFTEVLAGLFRYHPDLCLRWLEDLGALSDASRSELVGLSTQKRLSAPENHETGSRPDLEIVLRTGDGKKQVVFAESKLGAAEGEDQLWRYADHLWSMGDAEFRTLIYVTRDYDPKEEGKVLRGIENVRFVQTRWSVFYQNLRGYRRHLNDRNLSSELADEVGAYMQENGMSQQSRLSAADVSAMTAVPRVLNFMRETLGGEVSNRLAQVSGKKVAQRSQTLWRVEDQGRYYHYAFMANDFWCGAGFWLATELPDEYPSLSVIIEVGPRHPEREAIIEAMRSYDKKLGEPGYSYNLDDPGAWSGIEWWSDLGSLLGEEDHMAAARKFFMWGLDQAELFRNEYPGLPWGDER